MKQNNNKEQIINNNSSDQCDTFQCPEGYTLIIEEDIAEVSGTARFLRHDKTGARVIYISNDDDNKVFTIGFKTPSDDSTGVAHIMEHSVLCGSDKYPVKEPFVELAKGSLNTFLNAMTYPDKTVYPIASTNDKDFMNLMDVYCDAVFHPAIYHNPEIFMQEGWHYHLEKADDPIQYNGVVYNEMKGVYSSPEEVLNNELFKVLYPDTIYRGESGGHPDCIPNLTYEAFLDFHRRYYHPSNSYIYFYGNGDIREHLTYLDREYLGRYDRQPVDSQIPLQPVFDTPRCISAVYPVSAGEETEGKDYMTLGWVMDGSDYENMLMMDILGHVLLENNSAPLKKALLDLNICREVDYTLSTSLQQPYAAIVLKNTDQQYRQLFEDTVFDVLRHVADEGLDPLDVAAGINTAEFALREGESGSYPKGLILGLELFDTWLYDDGTDPFKPFDHLKYNRIFAHIRARAAEGGFEAMIRECFLDNPTRAMVVMTPDPALQPEQDRALEAKLAAYKSDLSEDAVQQMVIETQQLIAHQAAEDSLEALATIPKLSLDEIKKTPRTFAFKEESFFGQPLLWHEDHTSGIVYVKLCFDIHGISEEDLPVLSLLNKFLCEVGTADYDLTSLIREIEINTGGITGTLSLTNHTKNIGAYTAHLVIKGKALAEQVPKLMALIESVTLRPVFDDDKLLRDLIGEIRLDKEDRFLTAGHAVSVQRLQSYYSPSAALADIMDGIGFYRFITDLDHHYEEKSADIKARLGQMVPRLFTRKGLILSLTCESENKTAALEAIEGYLKKLPDAPAEVYDYSPLCRIRNEGFKTAAKVQYVAQGYNFRTLGYDYSGSLAVLKSVLYTGYLWTRIRVQGGAYGGMFGVTRGGELYFTSYRDPHLDRTFDVYGEAADHIAHLDVETRELEKYIIGTISSKDVPLSPPMLADASDLMYFNGTDMTDLQRERDEILNVTVADLQKAAKLVADCMVQNCFCVIGGEEAIEKASRPFGETAFLLEK